MKTTSAPKGLPYIVSNSKGFYYSDEEYVAQLLAEALSGDRTAYDNLCGDNLFTWGKYDAIIDAVKEKYGYED